MATLIRFRRFNLSVMLCHITNKRNTDKIKLKNMLVVYVLRLLMYSFPCRPSRHKQRYIKGKLVLPGDNRVPQRS